jgi:hypothetical protein
MLVNLPLSAQKAWRRFLKTLARWINQKKGGYPEQRCQRILWWQKPRQRIALVNDTGAATG